MIEKRVILSEILPSFRYSTRSFGSVQILAAVRKVSYSIQKQTLNLQKKNTRSKEYSNTEYGKKALVEELCDLSNTSKGERNNRLNQAAFCLGQLVASGDLEEAMYRTVFYRQHFI